MSSSTLPASTALPTSSYNTTSAALSSTTSPRTFSTTSTAMPTTTTSPRTFNTTSPTGPSGIVGARDSPYAPSYQASSATQAVPGRNISPFMYQRDSRGSRDSSASKTSVVSDGIDIFLTPRRGDIIAYEYITARGHWQWSVGTVVAIPSSRVIEIATFVKDGEQREVILPSAVAHRLRTLSSYATPQEAHNDFRSTLDVPLISNPTVGGVVTADNEVRDGATVISTGSWKSKDTHSFLIPIATVTLILQSAGYNNFITSDADFVPPIREYHVTPQDAVRMADRLIRHRADAITVTEHNAIVNKYRDMFKNEQRSRHEEARLAREKIASLSSQSSSSIEGVDKALADSQALVAKLEAELRAKTDTSSVEIDLRRKISELESRPSQVSSVEIDLRRKIAELESRPSQVSSVEIDLRRKIAELESRPSQVSPVENDLRHQISELESRTTNFSSIEFDLRTKISNLESQLAVAQSRPTDYTVIAAKDQDIDALKRKNTELESQLAVSTSSQVPPSSTSAQGGEKNTNTDPLSQSATHGSSPYASQAAYGSQYSSPSEIEGLKSQLAAYQSPSSPYAQQGQEIEGLKNTIAGLQSQLATSQSSSPAYAQQGQEIEGLKNTTAGPQSQLATYESSSSPQGQEIEGLKNTIAGLQSQLATYQSPSSPQSQEIEGLKNTIAGLQSQLATSQSSSPAYAQEGLGIEGLKNATAGPQSQLATYESSSSPQGQEIEGLKNTIAGLQSQLATYQSPSSPHAQQGQEVEKLNGALNELKGQLAEYKSQPSPATIPLQNQEIERLNSTIAELKSQLAAYEAQSAAGRHEIEKLNKNVDDLKSQFTMHVSQSSADPQQRREVEELNSNLASLKSELADYKSQPSTGPQQRQEVEVLNKTIADLKSQLATYESQPSTGKGAQEREEIERLNNTITELKSQLATYKAQSATGLQEIEKLNKSVAGLKSELGAYEAQVSSDPQQRREIEKLTSNIADLQSELATYKSQASASSQQRQDVETLNKTIADLEAQLAAAKRSIADLEAQLSEANNIDTSTDDQVGRAEFDNLRADYEEIEASCKEALTALERSTQRVLELEAAANRSSSTKQFNLNGRYVDRSELLSTLNSDEELLKKLQLIAKELQSERESVSSSVKSRFSTESQTTPEGSNLVVTEFSTDDTARGEMILAWITRLGEALSISNTHIKYLYDELEEKDKLITRQSTTVTENTTSGF